VGNIPPLFHGCHKYNVLCPKTPVLFQHSFLSFLTQFFIIFYSTRSPPPVCFPIYCIEKCPICWLSASTFRYHAVHMAIQFLIRRMKPPTTEFFVAHWADRIIKPYVLIYWCITHHLLIPALYTSSNDTCFVSTQFFLRYFLCLQMGHLWFLDGVPFTTDTTTGQI
jgi:hypothetical protein